MRIAVPITIVTAVVVLLAGYASAAPKQSSTTIQQLSGQVAALRATIGLQQRQIGLLNSRLAALQTVQTTAAPGPSPTELDQRITKLETTVGSPNFANVQTLDQRISTLETKVGNICRDGYVVTTFMYGGPSGSVKTTRC